MTTEETAKPSLNREMSSLDAARTLFVELRDQCSTAVQGRENVIDLVLIALFADGHVLLEDHPGSGKTRLAKTLGNCVWREDEGLIRNSRRIQFTPDLLPSDVTGATMFDPASKLLAFQRGPVFANVLLADEINRTSPKVQAALLEAMAEKQVTVDNHTYDLDELFFVIATQNPLDHVGTWPLPAAQLDRFLFKVKMEYLTRESELDVLRGWKSTRCDVPCRLRLPVETILAARDTIEEQVRVAPDILECLADVAQALRGDSRVAQGISTRSLTQAVPALQVNAMIAGRDFVSHEDIRDLAVVLFAHRLQLVPGVKDAAAVVHDCIRPALEKTVRKTLISRAS